MKIISLNVNGFRGMGQQNGRTPANELTNNLQLLKKYIDGLDIDEESIVVLQEIPHETVDTGVKPWIWEEDKHFNKFKQLFGKDYKIFYPRYLIHSKQCTVAVGRKSTKWDYSKERIIQYDEEHCFGNKLIEVEMNEITLLGVHINPCDAMWNILLNSLKNKKVSYIVGDFNAYEKRGTMKDKPKQLREMGYFPTIPSSVITDFKDNSSLDNLYISENISINNGMSATVCKLDTFVTDHAICIFDFFKDYKLGNL